MDGAQNIIPSRDSGGDSSKKKQTTGAGFRALFHELLSSKKCEIARRETGVGHATGALAVHDSIAAAVAVSLGAGGPGIGRRAARPPRTKNRGIRRKRNDATGGAAPRATRPGRYRADQTEMPRRATC